MQTKKVKVIMLPTDKSKLFIFKERNELQYGIAGLREDSLFQPQHLYFLSYDEIKAGDYYYSYIWKAIILAENNLDSILYRKILASTDSSLNLPLIPQSFIQKYVGCQGEIKEVELKMTTEHLDLYGENRDPRGEPGDYGEESILKLKLTSSNEVIIVNPPKEVVKTLSLEEVAKEHYPDAPLMSSIFSARKGFIAGANWMKEQLSK